MASELRAASPSGTLYARIINSAGLWWNGTSFEAYTAANYGNYDIAMTEQGDSGVYVADFPTGIQTSGTYEYYVHYQAGGSPTEGDQVVNTGRIEWTGTVSVSASAGSMAGEDWRDYVLRKGFKRTDKDEEVYEATTDAISEIRERFGFDEAQVDTETTDTISALGDFKLDVESDLGLLLGIILQDGDTGTPLKQTSRARFDARYPYAAIDTDFTGYPKDFCIYAGQIYIGPTPDSTSYTYRISYSRSAGTVTSTTTGVPFSSVLYRAMLCDLVYAYLYAGLEEPEKADYFRSKFENRFPSAVRRERKNQGLGFFNMSCQDC